MSSTGKGGEGKFMVQDDNVFKSGPRLRPGPRISEVSPITVIYMDLSRSSNERGRLARYENRFDTNLFRYQVRLRQKTNKQNYY